jgi:hypothetical protein
LEALLPEKVPRARILVYDYDALGAFFGGDANVNLNNHAATFVADLTADRGSEAMKRKPLIFLCHGLGGLLVKKALTYSAQKGSNHKLSHLFDVFNSTYALLFFSTPHTKVSVETGQAFREMAIKFAKCGSQPAGQGPKITKFLNSLPEIVHQDFSQHTGQFRMYCIWEELETTFRSTRNLVVDQTSAVIDREDVEKSGVFADHLEMTRLSSKQSPGYNIVFSTIKEWSKQAPAAISTRWTESDALFNAMKVIEGSQELGIRGIVSHSRSLLLDTSSIKPHLPTKEAVKFVGRRRALKAIYDAFFPFGNLDLSLKRNVFVVHGMGGSGKTELCSTFALHYQSE